MNLFNYQYIYIIQKRPITPSQCNTLPIMRTPPSSNANSNQVFTPSRIERSQPPSPSLIKNSTPIRTNYLQRPTGIYTTTNTVIKQNVSDVQSIPSSPVGNKRVIFPHNNNNNNGGGGGGGIMLKRPRCMKLYLYNEQYYQTAD